MSSATTLFFVTLAITLGCAVPGAYAAAPEPLPKTAVAPPAGSEPGTADFLQPLSRKLRRQLPDLGTSGGRQNRAEAQEPGFNTFWVFPKTATASNSTSERTPQPQR